MTAPVNDPSFKQRLLGAAVLVALAVLLLPAVLDGKKLAHYEEGLVPDPPRDIKRIGLERQLTRGQKELSPQVPATSTDAAGNGQDSAASDLKQTKGTTTGWVIQVGAFESPSNAKKYLEDMRKRGFPAYISRSVGERQGNLQRVFVGPYAREKDAQRALGQLKSVKGMKPVLVVFDPLEH
jgi:DedD protein